MDRQNKVLLTLLVGVMLLFVITGMLTDGPGEAFMGFLRLQLSPGRLINDFTAAEGVGATLLNAAVTGGLALGIILLCRIQLSGPTFATILTIMGFAFFGKTAFNILPVIGGVYIAAKFAGKSFGEYILIALFGTALGPLVSYLAFELGFTGIQGLLLGAGGGLITGFFLPAIAVSMLHLHQGYSLYNLGLSCGFFALFAAAIIRISGNQFEAILVWNNTPSPILIFLVPVLSLILLFTGFLSGRKQAFRDCRAIQKLSGRLPSDFMTMETMQGTLLNAGLLGLAGSAYVYLIGADFNGPVIGGLLTVIGFGAFGTHLRNAWPIVTGVVLTTLLFGKSLTDPGPILAFLFSTTLSPLAGQFGIVTGVCAGFLHFVLVSHTAAWQGGTNLYNNGFAGGLTAALIVAVIQWYQSNKQELT